VTSSAPRARLVESLPRGLEALRHPKVERTVDALVDLVDSARVSIDITALYWSLRPDPRDPEMSAWTVQELVGRYGADEGARLLDALRSAAARGIQIRIVQSPGFAGDGPTESEEVAEEFPEYVEVRKVDLDAWFGHGIMHQKILVVDGRACYVGSANMDWRSFTQVKELGVVVEDEPLLLADIEDWFTTWWDFAARQPGEPLPGQPVGPATRARSSWDAPLRTTLNGVRGEAVLSGSPRELCVPPRTEDAAVIAATILDATTSVCINVMDIAPINIYAHEVAGVSTYPTWWPMFTDAILTAVIQHGVTARLLVSEWAHTSPYVGPFLNALEATYAAARTRSTVPTGHLDIRRFAVPGWQQTATATHPQAAFPGHTRVNHVKYVVTDRRVNIGTSNMTWDYFHGTAGTSINLTHRHLVEQLQELFDRDWNSHYARHLG
jgi:phospholipase D3/4